LIKGLKLLVKLSQSVTQECFYDCLWNIIITTPSIRASALNFLSRKMPTTASREDMVVFCANQTQLIVDSICCLLEDTSSLVTRSGLDLVISHFHIPHSIVIFQRFFDRLLEASLSVLLRRDMSLNRRLFAWLNVGDDKIKVLVEAKIVESLQTMLYNPAKFQPAIQVILSLLDQIEFSLIIIEGCFLDAIRATIDIGNTQKDVRSINLVFE
jgi:hypothetical protein